MKFRDGWSVNQRLFITLLNYAIYADLSFQLIYFTASTINITIFFNNRCGVFSFNNFFLQTKLILRNCRSTILYKLMQVLLMNAKSKSITQVTLFLSIVTLKIQKYLNIFLSSLSNRFTDTDK